MGQLIYSNLLKWETRDKRKPSALPIHYFSTNDSQMEVDFIVQAEQRILPIEVKAEANVHSKSLRTFIEKNPDLKGIRFSTLPYKD